LEKVERKSKVKIGMIYLIRMINKISISKSRRANARVTLLVPYITYNHTNYSRHIINLIWVHWLCGLGRIYFFLFNM
jgi:hypothetical protein